MRRRALLSAVALGTAALAGCLAATRRQISGQILARHGGATLRPADERWVVGGLSAESDAHARAVLFAEAPSKDADVFTEEYPEAEHGFETDVLNADYERGFVLLYEVKMAPENAFVPLPRSTAGAEWTGWTRAALPMETSTYEPSQLTEAERTADELVAILVAYYEADRAPKRAEVDLYDESGNRLGWSTTAERWSS